MTNTSVKNTFAFTGFLVAVLFSMGAFATVVYADDYGFYPDSGGYGFYPDTGASTNNYGFYPDTSASTNYGFYPDVSASAGYGFYPDVNNGSSIDPNAGTIDMNASTIDANASSIDTYASSIDTNASSYPTYNTYGVYSSPGYGGYDSGYYATQPSYATLGIGYSSYPGYYATVPTYYSGGYSSMPTYYTTPGYTNPAPVVTSPSYNYAPTTITETTSTFAPTDVYTYSPTDVFTYSPTVVYSPTDSHDTVNSNNITNTISNSNNTTGPVNISIVSQAAPQNTVQYVSGGGSYFNTTPVFFNTPTYFPSPAPSCRIVAGGGYGFDGFITSNYYGNRAVVLSWTSNNANSGYITPLVGTVAPAGSTTVYPNQNTLYTLTVSGNGGTSSCQTYTGVSNYVAPAPVPVYNAPVITQTAAAAPYVALTQIPYTGFDFGTFGNALYWILLVGFAVAASYLVLYFRGGAFALVKGMIRGKSKSANPRGDPGTILLRRSYGAGTLPARASTHAGGQSQGVTSESAAVANLRGETSPARASTYAGGQSRGLTSGGTKDSMISVGSTDGAGPRIVVLRA
ncbi:MAG: hypothetical protein AAB899_01040 [Patescibacteria group bacterium]